MHDRLYVLFAVRVRAAYASRWRSPSDFPAIPVQRKKRKSYSLGLLLVTIVISILVH